MWQHLIWQSMPSPYSTNPQAVQPAAYRPTANLLSVPQYKPDLYSCSKPGCTSTAPQTLISTPSLTSCTAWHTPMYHTQSLHADNYTAVLTSPGLFHHSPPPYCFRSGLLTRPQLDSNYPFRHLQYVAYWLCTHCIHHYSRQLILQNS